MINFYQNNAVLISLCFRTLVSDKLQAVYYTESAKLEQHLKFFL